MIMPTTAPHPRLIHLRTKLCSVFLATTLLASTASLAQQPGGTAPTIINRPLSDVPNHQAITARYWVPDLDAGFVPQGLAVQNDSVILAGYVSTDTNQSRGPCKLIWVNHSNGRVTRQMALPSSCGHAGGVAAISGGRLVVADTRLLLIVSNGRVSSTVKLTGALRGAFTDFDGRDLWLGNYDRGGGTLWRIPLTALAKGEISEADAVEVLPAPANSQGLAFDKQGQIWVTTSGSREGAIHRLDRRSGQILATYKAPAGIEDIAFDGAGRLWASSEAGSRRWSAWATFFPLIFAIDVNQLK